MPFYKKYLRLLHDNAPTAEAGMTLLYANAEGELRLKKSNNEERSVGGVLTNLTAEEISIELGGMKTIPHSGYHRCILSKSANQQIDDTYTDIAFDQESLDVGGMHDVAIDNDRANISKDGVYFVFYKLEIERAANTVYRARVRINDLDVLLRYDFRTPNPVTSDTFLNCGDFFPLSENDYLTLQARQNSGSGKDVIKDNTSFSVLRLF